MRYSKDNRQQTTFTNSIIVIYMYQTRQVISNIRTTILCQNLQDQLTLTERQISKHYVDGGRTCHGLTKLKGARFVVLCEYVKVIKTS